MRVAPETELLLKHSCVPEDAALLVSLCPDAPSALRIFASRPKSATVFHTQDFAAHTSIQRALRQEGRDTEVNFGGWYNPPAPACNAGIVYLPRERASAEMSLALLDRSVHAGSTVWLVGRVRAGAKALRRVIEKSIGPVARTYAGRHSILYRATMTQTGLPPVSPDRWRKNYEFTFNGSLIMVVSLPGVFSHGRLDPGTRLLLDSLSVPPSRPARVLDFGCGAGPIGAALRRRWHNCQIDMIDRSAVAINSTCMTLDANDLDTGSCWASDSFSDIREKYNLIVSNPPFHNGIDTDFSVGKELIHAAADHLRPGGRLRIVTGRFLKYHAMLKTAFDSTQILAEDRTYRVVEATRRR